MEQFEGYNKKTQDGSKKDLSRREFLNILGLGGAAAFCFDVQKALGQEFPVASRYEKHGWFYTTEEMQKVYAEEYKGEKILKNIFQKSGDGYAGLVGGKELFVSEDFFKKFLEHLREMLEKKAAKFLFRLDAFHGHFFVPENVAKTEYNTMGMYSDAVLLVKDARLGVLYHNSEHLKLDNNDHETTALHAKRNVVGFWDGRPLEYLPLPERKRTAHDIPEGNSAVGPFLVFAANKDGNFSVMANNKEIRLDISFDDGYY